MDGLDVLPFSVPKPSQSSQVQRRRLTAVASPRRHEWIELKAMSEGSVSSTVAVGGGALGGYGSAAKEEQLKDGETCDSARKVQKSDGRWPALWTNWNDMETSDTHGDLES